jgi:hypothetical protein
MPVTVRAERNLAPDPRRVTHHGRFFVALDWGYTGTNTDRVAGAFLIRSRVKGGAFFLASGTIRWPGHPGLFMVELNRRTATQGAEEVAAVHAHPHPVRARAESNLGQVIERALHRYCSGCSRETEHVPWAGGGRSTIPSIQWPAAEPASGATICLVCGQLRAPASRLSPLAWSSWPRKSRELSEPGNRAPTELESAIAFHDGASEAAAENEGMPSKPDRRSTQVLARARPAADAVATRLERRRSDRDQLLTRSGVLVEPRRRDSAARVRRP